MHFQKIFPRSGNARRLFSDLYDNLNSETDNSISAAEWKQLFQAMEVCM